jgi:hypothetical protein
MSLPPLKLLNDLSKPLGDRLYFMINNKEISFIVVGNGD